MDVFKALTAYKLKDIPLKNLPREGAVQKMVMKQRKKVRHDRLPWVSGKLPKDFEPIWRMNDKSLKPVMRGKDFGGFAHFVKCVNSRFGELCERCEICDFRGICMG